MGWCGGTEIFDCVVKDILATDISDKPKKRIIKNLLNVLEDKDWDNVCESEYFDNPLVNKIIREVHPDWDYDE